MKLVRVTSNPFIIPVTPDPANYADNKICVHSSGGETIILPSIADLQSNEVDIFIVASGKDCTVVAQGADVIIGSTGAIGQVEISGSGTGGGLEFTPVSGSKWFSH